MTSPVIVFDVNETLSDLHALAGAFAAMPAPGATLDAWFAATLRDGFALTITGRAAPFADVARAALHTVAARHPELDTDADAFAEQVLAGFARLPVHADVVEGIRMLAGAGHRIVTLSNGAAAVGEDLLTRAGVADAVEAFLSVEDAGVWKPHPDAYAHAARTCGVPLEQCLLVAVHPWDVHGAQRAGMRGAYLDRNAQPYPSSFDAPDVTVPDLRALPAAVAGWSG